MAPPAVFCSSEGPASCASPQSTGSAPERAKAALGRIGPCVFNAIVSTFLAVVVIAFSKSFVFVTFFKAFFLVTVRAAAVSRGPPSAWAGPAAPPPQTTKQQRKQVKRAGRGVRWWQVVAGAHGLWLLPCLLGMVGGSNLGADHEAGQPPPTDGDAAIKGI
jgi:hypothetical protein